jgi:hypothetical protein
MVVGVAVLGGFVAVVAVVALIVAQTVASAEQRMLEVEAVERRIEARLAGLDLRLARIKEKAARAAPPPGARRRRPLRQPVPTLTVAVQFERADVERLDRLAGEHPHRQPAAVGRVEPAPATASPL